MKGIHRTKSTLLELALLIFTAAFVLCLSSPANAASYAAWSRLSPDMQKALQRDLGIRPEKYARFLEVQQLAADQETLAKLELGEQFGGFWLERDVSTGEFRPVVGSTAPLASAKKKSFRGIDVRQVKYSLAALQKTVSLLNRVAGSDPVIHSWGIDQSGNVVTMAVDPGRAAVNAASALIAASGADPGTVRIKSSTARPAPFKNIDAGDSYRHIADNFTSINCTAGFAVAYNQQWGFLTAGHCGENGKKALNPDVLFYELIGRVWHSVYNEEGDFAIVETANFEGNASYPLYHSTGWMKRSNKDYTAITGWGEAVQGGSICQYGQKTATYRCGRVLETNYTHDGVQGQVKTSACGAHGDSGGPVILEGDSKAAGIITGGGVTEGSNCGLADGDANKYSYYQPLQKVFDEYRAIYSDFDLKLGSKSEKPWELVGDRRFCLDVAGGSTKDGTSIQIYTCNQSDAQKWSLASTGALMALGKCLDVDNAGKKSGTRVQLWHCNYTGAQAWAPRIDKTIRNPLSRLCLGVPNGDYKDGAKLQVLDCNDTDAQKWIKREIN